MHKINSVFMEKILSYPLKSHFLFFQMCKNYIKAQIYTIQTFFAAF